MGGLPSKCLILRFDGVILSLEWKDALRDIFVTAAPSTVNRQTLFLGKEAERRRIPSELQDSDPLPGNRIAEKCDERDNLHMRR